MKASIMDRSFDDILLDTYALEYEKHRDEIQNRTSIQNQMAERAINITVMLVSLLTVLFTFFMKDYDSPSVGHRANLFISVLVPILLTHGVLTQLTLAVWIYQISMMFDIVRYWNWMVETKIEPMIGVKGEVFLRERYPEAPWKMAVDTKVVRYFQPLLVYGLCMVMLFTLPLVWWWSPVERGFMLVRVLGFVGSMVLVGSLTFLVVVHLKVVRGTEAFRKAIWENKQNVKNRTPSKKINTTS